MELVDKLVDDDVLDVDVDSEVLWLVLEVLKLVLVE